MLFRMLWPWSKFGRGSERRSYSCMSELVVYVVFFVFDREAPLNGQHFVSASGSVSTWLPVRAVSGRQSRASGPASMISGPARARVLASVSAAGVARARGFAGVRRPLVSRSPAERAFSFYDIGSAVSSVLILYTLQSVRKYSIYRVYNTLLALGGHQTETKSQGLRLRSRDYRRHNSSLLSLTRGSAPKVSGSVCGSS